MMVLNFLTIFAFIFWFQIMMFSCNDKLGQKEHKKQANFRFKLLYRHPPYIQIVGLLVMLYKHLIRQNYQLPPPKKNTLGTTNRWFFWETMYANLDGLPVLTSILYSLRVDGSVTKSTVVSNCMVDEADDEDLLL